MRYNGLAKEVRKRWSKGQAPEADDGAQGDQPERSAAAGAAGVEHDWTEDAQDQISALLGEVADDDEDEALDLAAIRKALADKEAGLMTDETPDKEGGLYLVIDEILSPEEPEAAVPRSAGAAAPEAPEPQAAETPDPEPAADEVKTKGGRTPAAAVMEPVFKDVVVTELLEQGTVTLPQALTAVRQQADHPETALWRILADLPEARRDLIYEAAANLHGFDTINVKDKFSPEFIQTIVELLSEASQESLFDFNLLPLKLKMDPKARQQRLLLVTHDPTHPELQSVFDGLGMPVDLAYAPEAVIAQYLEQVQGLLHQDAPQGAPQDAPQGAPQDAPAVDEGAAAVLDLDLTFGTEAVATEGAQAEAQDDSAPVQEIIDHGDDFLELQWEPLDEEPAPEEPPADAAEEATPSVEWKSLADLTDEPVEAETPDAETPDADQTITFDFTPDELAQLEPTDVVPTDEVSLDDTIAQELLDGFEGNGRANGSDAHHPEDPKNGEASFDGIPIEVADTEPIPDVADWTKPDEPEAPAAEAKPAAEPSVQAAPERDEADLLPRSPALAKALEDPDAEVAAPKEAPPEEVVAEEAADDDAADSTAESEESLEDLPDVDLEKIRAKDRVVAMLLRKEIIGANDVRRAQQKQKNDKLKEPLWRVLTLLDNSKRTAIFAEAASVYAFKTAEIGEGKPDPEFARSVMETFEEQLRDSLLRLRVVPFEVDLDQQTGAIKVVFITHDPTRPEVHRMMQQLRLERFELRYAPENVVTSLIHEAFPRKNEFLERLDGNDAFDMGISYEESNDLIDEEALEAEISRSKLINLFEATLVEAVRQDASDVHIWPNAKKQVEIHFRIDGRLRRWHVEDKVHPEAFIAVVKDNSMNIDRFERDSAQDGFIQRWIDEALIRFRVSILPIANAAQDVRSESIVIRVLDDRKVVKDLALLGLNQLALDRFRKAISQPHGMVILTGPTGSGKTTTLYASIHEVINPEVNVLTVEDPVEYILPGVRQIKLNNKLGLDGALRSILRHDPDVVMVGEMRDKATAELAIKLANTGHLTFSTLHTNDAASAVTRLYKMGIEPFLIAYAINLVVAQRLIRRLCPSCKYVDPDPDHVLMRKLGFTADEIEQTTVYAQANDETCPTCKGMGFKGRRAVSEAMYFSREVRHLIADSEGHLDEHSIKDIAVEQGMMTLIDSARQVVLQGDTSILEMMRVVSTEE